MTNYARYFERRTRDNGEAFYTLSDDCPDWLHDAVREAHDGELPNDWRYDTCHSIVSLLDDGEDDASSIADSLVDVYTSDLMAWLDDHGGRMSYCDEYLAEVGSRPDTLEDLIRIGQYRCIEQMAQILIEAVQDAESIVDRANDVDDILGSVEQNSEEES